MGYDLNVAKLAANGRSRSLSCFLMRGGAPAIQGARSYFA